MKTRILKLMAVAAVLSTFTGCIVLSVYPFYNDKDVIFDPSLAGRWIKDGRTNEFWQFSAAGEKFYQLATTDSDGTNGFEVHLFQLKEYQFMDLFTTNRDQFQLPLHLISKVTRDNDGLSLHFMDFGWLANLLQTNPVVLRHIVVPANPGETNDDDKMLYLTASTRDLQIFLLKYAGNTNAFSTKATVELKRGP